MDFMDEKNMLGDLTEYKELHDALCQIQIFNSEDKLSIEIPEYLTRVSFDISTDQSRGSLLAFKSGNLLH